MMIFNTVIDRLLFSRGTDRKAGEAARGGVADNTALDFDTLKLIEGSNKRKCLIKYVKIKEETHKLHFF
jgi:hypothetical protein